MKHTVTIVKNAVPTRFQSHATVTLAAKRSVLKKLDGQNHIR